MWISSLLWTISDFSFIFKLYRFHLIYHKECIFLLQIFLYQSIAALSLSLYLSLSFSLSLFLSIAPPLIFVSNDITKPPLIFYLTSETLKCCAPYWKLPSSSSKHLVFCVSQFSHNKRPFLSHLHVQFSIGRVLPCAECQFIVNSVQIRVGLRWFRVHTSFWHTSCKHCNRMSD